METAREAVFLCPFSGEKSCEDGEREVPRAPLKPCRTFGCTGVHRGEGWCEKCIAEGKSEEPKKRADRRRGSTKERGYSGAWRKIRLRVLAEEPICQTEGCVQPATDVDHIVPLSRGGTHARENLQALCSTHHKRKTAREDGGFGNPVKMRN